jgi:glycosyltransferase involved in cell wall biosynthesis
MMSVELSIVVPTCGRLTLRDLLDDLVEQMSVFDEVIVVGDGPQPFARATVHEFAPYARYAEIGPTRMTGNAQREFAIANMVRGSHLAFYDDDDRLIPGALAKIRTALEAAPDRPHLFRQWSTAGLIWKDTEVRCGNLSTQGIVVPNVPARLGKWGDAYEGDFNFIRSTVDLYPDLDRAIVWREEVVAVQGYKGTLVYHPGVTLRTPRVHG